MNEENNTSEGACRACWQNCGVQADAEMLDIDKMEDAIAHLDEHTARSLLEGRRAGRKYRSRPLYIFRANFICKTLAGGVYGQDHEIAIAGLLRFLAGFQLKYRPYRQQINRHSLLFQEHF